VEPKGAKKTKVKKEETKRRISRKKRRRVEG
jgi:hypothetical protein